MEVSVYVWRGEDLKWLLQEVSVAILVIIMTVIFSVQNDSFHLTSRGLHDWISPEV